MPLIACGINHQTAPLAIREQLAFAPERLIEPLQDLIVSGCAREAAILSTCNRTEFYCEIENSKQVSQWLHQWRNLPQSSLEPYLYCHQDQSAVRHIMRVASGLDSMVLGESQILGQMKQAVTLASQAGTLGTQLKRLFQHVFTVTKQVRTDTAIGSSPVSIAYTAVSLSKRIFADLSQVSALLIGAGDTIALTARHLREQNIGQLIIANRTLANAQHLARQFKGEAITIAEILTYLSTADIIITATASPLPILGKGSVETALKVRKHRPIFMVDLAVPRDIEPEVALLDDVYLYTVDDLQACVQENLQHRQKAAQQAEQIIDFQAAHFIRKLRSLDSIPMICAYREKIDGLCQDELTKAIKKIQSGLNPEQVMGEFARLLANKLLHQPTIQLRQAAYNGQFDMLAFAKQLFDLKD